MLEEEFDLRFELGDEFVDLLEKYKELKKLNKTDVNEYNEIYPIMIDIIENKNTPILFKNEMFNEIIKYNNDNGCKIFVLNHIDCPIEILEKLCNDESDFISLKALEKLDSLNINLKETIEQASNYSSNENESTNSNKHKNKH